jgi:ParB family chromosome partitioning protein
MELINSMRSTGGQNVPAIVRRIHDDPLYDYEVIAGNRRHFAVSWLRARGRPDIKFVGVVVVMTDEEAFLLADAENRTHKDVSDFERARNYASALVSHFDGKQARMAKRMGVSKSWLSKMLTVAAVPLTVLDAFDNLSEVSVAGFYNVAKLLQKSDVADAIEREAQKIAREQENRSWGSGTPIKAPEVIRRLKAAALQQKAEPHEQASAKLSPTVTVTASDSQDVTLRLQSGSRATRDEVLQAVATALDALHANGQSLWL